MAKSTIFYYKKSAKKLFSSAEKLFVVSFALLHKNTAICHIWRYGFHEQDNKSGAPAFEASALLGSGQYVQFFTWRLVALHFRHVILSFCIMIGLVILDFLKLHIQEGRAI